MKKLKNMLIASALIVFILSMIFVSSITAVMVFGSPVNETEFALDGKGYEYDVAFDMIFDEVHHGDDRDLPIARINRSMLFKYYFHDYEGGTGGVVWRWSQLDKDIDKLIEDKLNSTKSSLNERSK